MSRSLRHTIWFSRVVLLVGSVLFLAIASRYLLDPVKAGAPYLISFNSAAGITIGRVGFGGFPLAVGIVLVACLISAQRLLIGLRVMGTVLVVVTAVRVLGLVVDGPAPFTVQVLKPEITLVVLTAAAIFLERRRRSLHSEGTTRFGQGIGREPSEQS